MNETCPFCGHKVCITVGTVGASNGKQFAECANDDCYMCYEVQMRLEDWNRRAPSPREQRLEKALREILEGFNAHTVMDIARRALADESEGK